MTQSVMTRDNVDHTAPPVESEWFPLSSMSDASEGPMSPSAPPHTAAQWRIVPDVIVTSAVLADWMPPPAPNV